VAYLGFGLFGLGVSVIGPMGLALVGKMVAPHFRTEAISRAAVMGFSGFFFAPVLMGLVSQAFGPEMGLRAGLHEWWPGSWPCRCPWRWCSRAGRWREPSLDEAGAAAEEARGLGEGAEGQDGDVAPAAQAVTAQGVLDLARGVVALARHGGSRKAALRPRRNSRSKARSKGRRMGTIPAIQAAARRLTR
jgi:hypothetical protein